MATFLEFKIFYRHTGEGRYPAKFVMHQFFERTISFSKCRLKRSRVEIDTSSGLINRDQESLTRLYTFKTKIKFGKAVASIDARFNVLFNRLVTTESIVQ